MIYHVLLLFISYHLTSSKFINPILSANFTLRNLIEADRVYYIAAIDIDWDYAPNGTVNPFTNIEVRDDEDASVYTAPGEYRIGSVYKKAVYREYTDITFTTQKERNSKWEHLGVLGPVIRGIVGERIKIIFFNNASGNYSMHPHGVQYNELSEGAMYKNNFDKTYKKSVLSKGGQKVLPGQKWVYIWDCRDNTAGSDNEFSSKFWWYHSHIHETMDTNTGLVGPILITKPNYARDEDDNLMPYDVDREFVTLFTVMDENQGWYLKDNLMRFATGENGTEITDEEADDYDYDDEDFQESNLMHSMNGLEWNALGQYITGILKGEKVRWYIGGMGTEVDIHSAHWHGNIIKKDSVYEDVVQLMPAYTTTVDMYADNAGTWFYHCHVNDHVEAGMIATYTVQNETCTDCVGISMDDVDTYSSNVDEDLTFNETLSRNETWFIVIISFVINWFVILMIWIMYRMCCNRDKYKRKESFRRGTSIANDDLTQSMLEMK